MLNVADTFILVLQHMTHATLILARREDSVGSVKVRPISTSRTTVGTAVQAGRGTPGPPWTWRMNPVNSPAPRCVAAVTTTPTPETAPQCVSRFTFQHSSLYSSVDLPRSICIALFLGLSSLPVADLRGVPGTCPPPLSAKMSFLSCNCRENSRLAPPFKCWRTPSRKLWIRHWLLFELEAQ